MMEPSSRQLARHGLDMVGYGMGIGWTYWPLAVPIGLVDLLPEWLRNRKMLGIALKEKTIEDAALKSW